MGDTRIFQIAEQHDSPFSIVRQRTIGSPARDYIPILRGAGWLRYVAGKALGIKGWSYDEKEENAREYRKMQQVYINKMLGGLKERIENGDETPSILGNILRQGLLKEEELLLASYTGSKFTRPCGFNNVVILRRVRSRCWRESRLLAYLDHRIPGEQARPAAKRPRGHPPSLPRRATQAARVRPCRICQGSPYRQ